MATANPKVDGYIRKNKQWQKELSKLRSIVLTSELTEDVKWRVPCYTLDDKNVVLLGSFKDCCVISFVKGALLKDPKGILELPGENTQSARVVRCRDLAQIEKIEPVLQAYIREAIAIERSGAKVDFKAKRELTLPDELQAKFKEMPDLKTAFTSLTPGRQRAYVMHFSSAKQPKTRESRVEKCVQRILAGKGLDDD